ncbi:MAG TPA: S41 family peptidase [Longimicrobium sp.]|jgi:carboxyl-terminal processing protease|uniref:S41 family peptidase n=1 Tax=Longimicrobium sp. TaxID=2029185 RepID=UPI002ED7A565
MMRRKTTLAAVRRTRAPAAPPARRRGLRRAAATALVLPVFAGGFALQAWGGRDGEQMFHEVVSRVATMGLDSLTDAQLYEKAARGLLVQVGDPYAELFSPEQLAEFSRMALRNSYTGVGMVITTVRDTATVTRVFSGSPAAQAGVQPGDRIVRVGGEPVTGIPLEAVTQKLLGTPGTRVEVDYVRHGTGPVHHSFTRERIRYPSVGYAVMVEPGIGYVPLESFNDTSGDEVMRALVSLRKSGATSYVLDLRGNTGGSLEQAVRIGSLFLRQGQQVLRADFRGAPDETYVARDAAVAPDAPLVVLTDGQSASASEIVAGALQDHDRAVVIGTTSFGKGLVQDVFPLEGGWALKLTTGRWYTPSGRTIQRPRRLTPEGRLVETPADSVTERPVFRSDAGRPVYGGGGITPDVLVQADTLVGAELALMRELAPRGGLVNEVLQEMAVDLGPTVAPDAVPGAAWREDLYRRLERRGLRVDPARYRAGAPLVDRLLEDRVLEFAYGDSAAFRRTIPRDKQLQSAIQVLRGARSQTEALARAAAAGVEAPRTRS